MGNAFEVLGPLLSIKSTLSVSSLLEASVTAMNSDNGVFVRKKHNRLNDQIGVLRCIRSQWLLLTTANQ